MQVSIANTEKEKELMPEVETTPLPEEDIETFFAAYADSLAKAGNHEKNYRLKEVTIKAKREPKKKRYMKAVRNRLLIMMYIPN